MSGSLQATFQFLAKTENRAALDVLIAALDCPHQVICSETVRALLQRRDAQGHREVFRRLPSLDEQTREVINQRPERLSDAVSDALQDPSPEACAAACDAIVSFCLYGVLPALTSVLVDTKTAHADLLAATALRLAELFYAELSGVDEQPKRKQRDNLRDRITSCLEDAVRKFHRHRRIEIVEAMLLLTRPSSAALRQILQRPRESSHAPVLNLLSNSPRGGVIRLLLGFLDDPQMPQVVSKVLGSRSDQRFVEHLLWTIGPKKPSKTLARTLARLKSVAWANPDNPLLSKLDDTAQAAAVQLMLASSVDRHRALELVTHFLREGKPGGRRAAASALEYFDDPKVADLIVEGLDDKDPQVRAALLVQLRPRKIPETFSLLVRMVGSPEEEVKCALRKAMPEFSLTRFLPNLEAMDDGLRPIAGYLVRMIDGDILGNLAPSFQSPSHAVRRRALLAASAMGLVESLEDTVINMLSDDDHTVRAAAAEALADCKSRPTWEALRDALLDNSLVVREAAQQSLETISQCLLRPVEEEEEEEEGQPQEAAP